MIRGVRVDKNEDASLRIRNNSAEVDPVCGAQIERCRNWRLIQEVKKLSGEEIQWTYGMVYPVEKRYENDEIRKKTRKLIDARRMGAENQLLDRALPRRQCAACTSGSMARSPKPALSPACLYFGRHRLMQSLSMFTLSPARSSRFLSPERMAVTFSS